MSPKSTSTTGLSRTQAKASRTDEDYLWSMIDVCRADMDDLDLINELVSALEPRQVKYALEKIIQGRALETPAKDER